MKTENKRKKIHFIGIGGIGMSALAHVCYHKGMIVQGSDRIIGAQSRALMDKGVNVYLGHDALHIDRSVHIVVASSAISHDNPEYQAARQMGIPLMHRSELLRQLLQSYRIFAVTGTHGKTTTTALLGCCLCHAGMDPFVMVGGIMQGTGTNFLLGKSNIAVVEADESDKSHLQFDGIDHGIITNIDHDHMDTYNHCWDTLLDSFVDFVRMAQHRVMMNGNDPGCCALFEKLTHEDRLKIWRYGTHVSHEIQLLSYRQTPDGTVFSCKTPHGVWKDISLHLWGYHNIMNALGSLGLALSIGGCKDTIDQGMRRFAGVQRRMSRVGVYQGIPVIDDYAHHPTAIKSNLQILVDRGYKKILCVFEPHRYTRLKQNMDAFVDALSNASLCVILPVYSAGEDAIDGATSYDLAEKISKRQEYILYDKGHGLFKSFLDGVLNECDYDVIIFFGAGDVTDLAHRLVK